MVELEVRDVLIEVAAVQVAVPVVEAAVVAATPVVEEAAKVVETKVEAVVAPVVKTVADLAVGEVGHATLLLDEAKKKAQSTKDKLMAELATKEAEIKAELAKLEPVFVENVKVVEKAVEKVVSSGLSVGEEVLATEASFSTKHPVLVVAISFVVGAIVSGLTVWGCL